MKNLLDEFLDPETEGGVLRALWLLPCAYGWYGEARCCEDPDGADSISKWCAPCQIRKSVSTLRTTCPECKALVFGGCPHCKGEGGRKWECRRGLSQEDHWGENCDCFEVAP